VDKNLVIDKLFNALDNVDVPSETFERESPDQVEPNTFNRRSISVQANVTGNDETNNRTQESEIKNLEGASASCGTIIHHYNSEILLIFILFGTTYKTLGMLLSNSVLSQVINFAVWQKMFLISTLREEVRDYHESAFMQYIRSSKTHPMKFYNIQHASPPTKL
ncbi:hypothetical protein Trydic_g19890, partial [Trypoxylus dichotomus]